MYIKIHKSYRNVVALCDSDLLGKIFEEPISEQSIKQLDVRENFYKGDEIDAKKALEILKSQTKEDSTFNIVGSESINTALEAGIIDEKSIGKIHGVPYALVLL